MSAAHLMNRICASAAVIFIATTVMAATDSDWSFHAWLSDDGLPNNNVSSIGQTPDGYLWVATPTAFARFDGVRFETFSPKLFGLEPGQRIRALCRSHDDGLWLATDNGAILAKANHTQVFTNIPNARERILQTALEGDDGSLWMAFNYGVVCRLKRDGEATQFTVREGMPVGPICSLVQSGKGQIWFAKSGQKNSQVGFYRDGYFQTALTLGRPVIRLAPCRSGGIWICSGTHLLKYEEGGTPQDAGDFLPERSGVAPSTVLEDSHGNVWIGTADSGLFRFDGAKFEQIQTSQPQISDVMEDREGNIWVGTLGGGLNRLRPRAVDLVGAEQGLPFASVMSLCEDTNHVLWAATQNGLLAYRQEGVWKTVADVKVPGQALCVASDHHDGVWIGTAVRALYHLQGGRLSVIGPKDGLLSRRIRSLLVASNGDVWIGGETPDSIQRLRDGGFKTFAIPHNAHLIRTMAEDSAGNVWAGTSGGFLLRITGDSITNVNAEIGFEGFAVRSLCTTPDGSVWIGYAGDGLGRLKNGHFMRITTAQGLFDGYISQIVADDRGWLWFGSDRGIFKVQQAELSAVADGQATRVHSTHYGRGEGLSSLQANFDFSPGAIRSSDGRIWIPMRTGLASINPDALAENPPPPAVLMRQVTVDDQVVAAYGGVMPVPGAVNLQHQTELHLPPSYRRVQFDFAALNFSAPENVHFRCRLDNFDDNWVETEIHNVIYPRLAAGTYRFHVQARNENGAWNEAPVALTMIVTPFFWQTWWFQLAAVALFTSIVIAVVRYISFRRLRQKLHALEQQAALDKERARIARDIHDDLGGSMTQITLLSGLLSRDISKPAKATDYADRISTAARNVTDSLDEIVWAVNPRNDTLPHLVNYLGKFTSEYLATTGLKCRMDLPSHPPDQFVSSETRHNLFLALKEALNNVTRHSHASEVVLQITIDDRSMSVTITDNGHGFTGEPKNGTAEGLFNMRQRMQDIGGQFKIQSGSGGGTKVSFTFPLAHSLNGKNGH